jgi:hypothetical protein
MPVKRENGPTKIYLQFELKANLGNYESAGFSVGYEVPPGADLVQLRKQIEVELYTLGKEYLADFTLPLTGPKAAGQVAIALKKGPK